MSKTSRPNNLASAQKQLTAGKSYRSSSEPGIEFEIDFSEEKDMDKRFWIAGIAASVLVFLLGFLVHGVILAGDYMELKNLFRPEKDAMGFMPVMILAHVIMGFALAWIYSQGISGDSWLSQGLRFGIAAALLVTVPWYLIFFSIQPWPASTIVKMIVLDAVSLIITAIAVAYIYKPNTSDAA
jgi:hypothetical protein